MDRNARFAKSIRTTLESKKKAKGWLVKRVRGESYRANFVVEESRNEFDRAKEPKTRARGRAVKNKEERPRISEVIQPFINVRKYK